MRKMQLIFKWKSQKRRKHRWDGTDGKEDNQEEVKKHL